MSVTGVGKGDIYKTQPVERSQSKGKDSFRESLALAEDMTTQELMQEISSKKEEIYTKVKNGELEERFQIGNQSLTLKEWDKLLDIFDASQDKLKALLEEKLEEQKKADIQARMNDEQE